MRETRFLLKEEYDADHKKCAVIGTVDGRI